MSLPYASGQSWYFYGPHNYGDDRYGPWNSLDLSGGDGRVLAARGGTVHRDCPTGFVRVDHGDGYETTYYHIVNIAVSEGQLVTRGQYLGDTGSIYPCGGFAQGAHVHFSLWYFTPPGAFNWLNAQMKDLAGVQMGQWVVSRGSAQYFGCLTSGQSYCSQGPPNWIIGGPTYNDLNPMAVDALQGDVNGDGRTDLVAVNGSSVFVMLSTGSGFQPSAQWSSAPFVGSRAMLLADLTGTGKADLVAVNDSSTWVMLSTGTGFSAPAQWSNKPFYGTRATLLADLNGDGKADLVAVNDNSIWVMLSSGTGFRDPAQWPAPSFYGSVTTLLGDVTGDHKADLVAINGTSTWVLPSTGTGFGTPAQWSGSPFVGTRATLLGDVIGSGWADLVAVNESSTFVMLSTGIGFGASTQWSSTSSKPPYGTRVTLLGNVTCCWADLVAVNDAITYVMPSSGSSFGDSTLWSSETFYGSRTTL